MTPEELLKPRIKMIAPIPKIFSAGIEPGQIWTGYENNGEIYFNLTNAHRIVLKVIKNYPHLFKELDWRQERERKDLPDYINDNGIIIKVDEWEHEPHNIEKAKWVPRCGRYWRYHPDLLPATEQEFNNQQK